MPTPSTYSIVACDLEADQWGVAVQSKFLAVGSLVPWAEPNVGAVATQALVNPTYGPQGLRLLRSGLSAEKVLDSLIEADPGRDRRQVGIVDARGRSATYTGSGCQPWAGGHRGPFYAAQGNIVVSKATVDALASTFEASAGAPLPERLLDALEAAQVAGGDRRGQQSAALLVVEPGAGYGGLMDVFVDLRVDDDEQPVEELRRLYILHQTLYGKTPDDEWVVVDEGLAAELSERLRVAGYVGELRKAFERWAGAENLENRVRDVDRIDPVVLKHLRATT